MPIKNRLKEIRMTEYMMNITEFANILGYPPRIVSSWEKGVRPTIDKALDVSNKLKKTVNEIWYLE